MISSFETESILEALYVAAQFYEHDCLNQLISAVGEDTVLSPDESYFICEQAVSVIFKDTKAYYHDRRYIKWKDTYTDPKYIFVMHDPRFTRCTQLVQEYGRQKQLTNVENPYYTRLEGIIQQSMSHISDYDYDYYCKLGCGENSKKSAKLVLFLGEEFGAFYDLPEPLFDILDYCEETIPAIESELEKLDSKRIAFSDKNLNLKEAA